MKKTTRWGGFLVFEIFVSSVDRSHPRLRLALPWRSFVSFVVKRF